VSGPVNGRCTCLSDWFHHRTGLHNQTTGNGLSTPHSQLLARLGQGAGPAETIAAEIVASVNDPRMVVTARIFWDSIAPSHGSALKTAQEGRTRHGKKAQEGRHCD